MKHTKEQVREALMRLSMCARKECEICKYKDRPKAELPSENCKERSTRNMNILCDAVIRDESKNEKAKRREMTEDVQIEHIYEILIYAMTHQNEACDTKCFVCDYSDRGCCGKIVDAMAKRIYYAGYRPTEKGGVE